MYTICKTCLVEFCCHPLSAFISHTRAIYLPWQRNSVNRSHTLYFVLLDFVLALVVLAYWPCPQFQFQSMTGLAVYSSYCCCVAITFDGLLFHSLSLVGSLINATVMQIAHKTPCNNMWNLIEKRKST